MILPACTKCLSSWDYQALIIRVDKYHYPHFTDRETKWKKGSVSCPDHTSREVAEMETGTQVFSQFLFYQTYMKPWNTLCLLVSVVFLANKIGLIFLKRLSLLWGTSTFLYKCDLGTSHSLGSPGIVLHWK